MCVCVLVKLAYKVNNRLFVVWNRSVHCIDNFLRTANKRYRGSFVGKEISLFYPYRNRHIDDGILKVIVSNWLPSEWLVVLQLESLGLQCL